MSRFFIERPIFAAVIAIIVALIGLLAILKLPIAQYPDIAPPAVSISGVYPGASAQTVESSVTQVIEQQLTGLDHLIYFSSTSSSDGEVQITATFAPGTNADIAQVQVQNKLQEATPLLPAVVQQQGLTVSKSNASFLLIVAIYDTSGRYNNIDLGDYLNSYLAEPIERVDGVGAAHVFGGQYAMRIWLEPFKLQQYSLTPTDIETAIQSQNVQVAAGQLGAQPAPKGQELNATVSAQSLLTTPDQFKQIVVKTQPDGSVVRLSDVANVEMGADNYQVTNRLNGHEASGLAVQLAPGANALKTADLVKA
ncbi:MAG: efflux RND transporter permease subunit, partial [Caulobacteraceae bacterium]